MTEKRELLPMQSRLVKDTEFADFRSANAMMVVAQENRFVTFR